MRILTGSFLFPGPFNTEQYDMQLDLSKNVVFRNDDSDYILPAEYIWQVHQ